MNALHSLLHGVFIGLVMLTGVTAANAESCKDCGNITDIRNVKTEGKASGVGAVAGGVVGGLLGNQVGGGTGKTLATVAGVAGGAYAGHEVEKRVKAKTLHRVTVRLDNGETRTVSYEQAPGFAVGDRVRFDNGALIRVGR